MSVLAPALRKELEDACIRARSASEEACKAALGALGVSEKSVLAHLTDAQRILRRGLRAKGRQLGDEGNSISHLASECAYEQWHRLMFARFLSENGLLIHPLFRAPITLAECEELAASLDEPDGWAVAGRFAAEILPGIFRVDDPCVQLRLAPEGRLELEGIVSGLPAEVFVARDSLGWVYQYWQREKKDEVNESERKIGGSDLGPVTQLFTENYMVRFLLENSLGAWWASRHPDSQLTKHWEFLRVDDDGAPSAGSFGGWPERVADVTVMDPCCGSGHFLVEAFEMLWRMRAEEEHLGPLPAQDAVLRDNLFGLELDPRCVQIAMFAVALAAWKAGGGWRDLPVPNVACSGIPVKAPTSEWTALAEGNSQLENALVRLHILFQDADTLGSLIDPKRAIELADSSGIQSSFDYVAWDDVAPLLVEALSSEEDDPTTAVLGADAAGIARAADFLSRQYTLESTNVPYLLRRRQEASLSAFTDARFPRSSADLATVFIERAIESLAEGASAALVLPNAWTGAASYEALRRHLLSQVSLNVIARLGAGAFRAISGEVVNVLLMIVTRAAPQPDHDLQFIDASAFGDVGSKREGLLTVPIFTPKQNELAQSVAARISKVPISIATLLSNYCHAYKGLTTGDDPRWKQMFWELPEMGESEPMQTASSSGDLFDGLMYCIRFHEMTEPLIPGVEVRGQDTWGKTGIALSQMSLRASLSVGAKFDQNVAVLLPNESKLTAPIYAFCSSPEYVDAVREVDQGIKVTNATLTQVPFDVEHWRQVAAEQFPDGLPAPCSRDATQWVFEGRPEAAMEPLQVAVARLLGYHWPGQEGPDDLDGLADGDGIVCIPSVAGEQSATDRLQGLLAVAFGSKWSPANIRKLLDASGSKKSDLESWLREDFFKAHCQLFRSRPFIWQIWDGRKDGFSALVNYHRLDRHLLENLAYTYLGDWIERQEAGVRDDATGAEMRLAAAQDLQRRLHSILEGESPFDIYVRWKTIAEQPIGWEPDIKDGVRLNIRPFVQAQVLRAKFNIKWDKDRGKNSDGTERSNESHVPLADKQAARGLQPR